MAGAGAGYGGGLEVGLIDPSDRGEFIDQIVRDFEQNGTTVDQPVVDFIKKEAVIGDSEWEKGVKSGRLNVHRTRQILIEGLEASADAASRAGRPSVDVSIARPTFIEVVEGRWQCPYGFLLC